MIDLTATVTGQGPSGAPALTGTVTWPTVTCASQTSSINGITGTWTCDAIAQTAGSYTAAANYGSDRLCSGTSPPVQVNAVTPSVTVTPTFNGGTLTFTATVAGPPGGATPTDTGSWNLSGPNGLSTCPTTTSLTGTGNPQGTATATSAVAQAPPDRTRSSTPTTETATTAQPAVPRAIPFLWSRPRSMYRQPPQRNAHLYGHSRWASRCSYPNRDWDVDGRRPGRDLGLRQHYRTDRYRKPARQRYSDVHHFGFHPAAGNYTVTYAYNGDGNYNPTNV